MKKYIIIFIILLFPLNVFALEKQQVTLKKCVDGDTAKFIMNNKEIKVRFLAVDTPETSHPKKGEEPYGNEAKEFTCNKLTNAKKIELEFDENSDKKDKYDRYLAWVFYDDYLLQSELVKEGLAEVAYLYGDYKYTSILKDNEEFAKVNKKGIYSDVDNSYYTKNKKNNEENLLDKYLNKLKADINKLIEEFLKEIFK